MDGLDEPVELIAHRLGRNTGSRTLEVLFTTKSTKANGCDQSQHIGGGSNGYRGFRDELWMDIG